jgi:hypothetical protein
MKKPRVFRHFDESEGGEHGGMVTIVVPASYKDHGNELPKKLERLAKRLKVKSDGGGYAIGGKNYDHWFHIRDREVANKFKDKASKLGFLPFIIPHFEG